MIIFISSITAFIWYPSAFPGHLQKGYLWSGKRSFLNHNLLHHNYYMNHYLRWQISYYGDLYSVNPCLSLFHWNLFALLQNMIITSFHISFFFVLLRACWYLGQIFKWITEQTSWVFKFLLMSVCQGNGFKWGQCKKVLGKADLVLNILQALTAK